jgi:hypothetical protein
MQRLVAQPVDLADTGAVRAKVALRKLNVVLGSRVWLKSPYGCVAYLGMVGAPWLLIEICALVVGY